MSTIKANSWLNPDGTENYKCRAWVNFNGTGTVAIRASGNVSSITDNGTGDYTVNFTNEIPDANFGVTSSSNGNIGVSFTNPLTLSTSSVRVQTQNGAATKHDSATVCVAIFR